MTGLKRNFKDNTQGQVGLTFALAAVPLFAIMSAAVDFTAINKERRAISGALDAAVIAAAMNNAIALEKKPAFAESHFRANYDGDVVVDLTSSVKTDIIRVNAEGDGKLTFGRVLGIKPPRFAVSSAASLGSDRTICVLSLSEDADAAISFGQDMEFDAPNCAVHSNSDSISAIEVMNAVQKPLANSFCAVGGIEGEVEPRGKGECAPIEDPYVDRAPAKMGPCVTDFLYEIGDVQHPVDIAMSGTQGAPRNSGSGSGNGSFEIAQDVLGDLGDLPVAPAQPVAEVKEHLRNVFGETHFSPPHGRSGNDWANVELIAVMGGEQLQDLLALYELGDGHLHCAGGQKIAECDSFAHPFQGKDYADTPDKDVVAEVFDFLYGDSIVPPETAPAILGVATIVYLNGRLYSRDNIDGRLVHISKNLTGGNAKLRPGTYCGGLTVDGLNVDFTAGDYIMKDGPLTFLNNSEATARDVTFSFVGKGATLNIESGSELEIKAPSKGPRMGLAFMEMKNASDDGAKGEKISRIKSGGQLSMAGTAYFPTQKLEVVGEASHIGAKSDAVGLIADKISFRGRRGARVELHVDHTKAGVPPIEPRTEDGARLVE